jgi:hypothetical protein
LSTLVAPEVSKDPLEIPADVAQKMQRGRQAMRKNSVQRRLNYKFWRGDPYWYVNAKNLLVNQSTVSWLLGGDKPSHRIRNKYPFIAMIVAAKVSASTQRIPGYEIIPSTVEPEDAQAAALAEKVALWGYDEWGVRRTTTQAFTHAFVGGEGFVYPYFDNTIGPYIQVQNPDTGEIETVGQGEVATKILSANEVYWEPGVDFEKSRWYCIEQARPLEEVRAMPGFYGGELSADATDSDAPSDAAKGNLVLVSEYFERPSAKRPKGQWIVMANKRQIVPVEDYPCQDHQGEVADEPVLIRISYTVEVDDRDRSLVEQLIDLERTIHDCWNKLLEWKNRCLNPQMTAPRGSNMARRDDTPAATWHYTPVGGLKPEWERPPQIPRELFELLDKAIEHMRAIAADVDVQPDPNLAARTAIQAVEQNQQRWQSFLGDAAQFHSRLMRRYLNLVQRHYSEPRLIKIQGLFGPDLTPGFLGADLLGQADVRVNPDSLQAKSRKAVIDETLLFADRQWITPQAAMASIQGGVAEKLGQEYAFHVARAWYIIQTIKRGEQELFKIRPRPPFPGEVGPGVDPNQPIPGWMPRPFDNVDIHRQVFEMWMLTTDWDRLPDPMRHCALLYYQAVLDIQQKRQLDAQVQQQQMAEALGQANAAKPQQASPMPDQRQPLPPQQ